MGSHDQQRQNYSQKTGSEKKDQRAMLDKKYWTKTWAIRPIEEKIKL